VVGALTPLLTHAYTRVGVPLTTATEAVALVPRVYTDPRWWTVFPDTVPALTELREAGRRSVILSNHVPELPALVRDLGLAGLVDDVIGSAQTGFEKPHPRMYATGLARAGRPATAWMVGDNPVADVAGARAAGLSAILVRHEPGADLTGAVRKIISG
jgi:putative hydrolase of the HAD superfamily